MMKKLDRKGFSAVEGLLLLAVVAVIGGLGWWMYHNNHKPTTTTRSTTTSTQPSYSTFKNDTYQLSYPKGWIAKEDQAALNSPAQFVTAALTITDTSKTPSDCTVQIKGDKPSGVAPSVKDELAKHSILTAPYKSDGSIVQDITQASVAGQLAIQYTVIEGSAHVYTSYTDFNKVSGNPNEFYSIAGGQNAVGALSGKCKSAYDLAVSSFGFVK